MHRQLAMYQSRHTRATRLTKHQSGGGIHVHKHLLNRADGGLIGGDHFADVLKQHRNALRQGRFGRGFDAA